MKIPQHIAIIMDGNGRWAKKRGFQRQSGHARGAYVADNVAHMCSDHGIKYLTLYAFSTENWKRPQVEINFLFNLTLSYLKSRLPEMKKEGVRFRFLGRINDLPPKLKEFCDFIETETFDCKKLTVIIALNYGGRAEIVDAVNKIIERTGGRVDEKSFKDFLYLPDVPYPDLIIRTSGEERLSNFLIWQGAYSELYFADKLWPDFTHEDFELALKSFDKRQRKYGAVI
jgi:undecaprenyl diphosphate synthase